jgi:N-acetylmuramoyl-L-alanine amidase
MTRLLFLIFGVLLTLVAPMAASAAPSVDDVRIGVHPDKTRFVLELSESPRYRVFTLPDPYRVVIDLPQVDWTPVASALPKGEGVISALRYGLFTPGTSRVVLDVLQPVSVESLFVLPPRDGHKSRLVLDLKPIERADFLRDERRRPIESAEILPAIRHAAFAAPAPAPSADPRPTVVIDAGHGGVDPGAIGVSGTYEKNLTLTYAKALQAALEKTGRYHVALTRGDDHFIPLRQRVAMAEQAEGDLFISLHANTHPSHKIRGAAVYTLSENASDAEAAALAAKENKADLIAGVNLDGQTELVSQILIDLAQRETMNFSKSFANLLVRDIGERTKLVKNSHRSAGFAVLKSASVPSVLFEIGYMSNREEERQLSSAKHRARLVEAMAKAIDSYFEVQQAMRR